MFLKKYQSYLPFLFGLITGVSFFNLDLLSPHAAHLPGDLGDARFNHYLLEHAYQFFSGKLNSYWNAPFLYPEKNVITYSDNLLGSAPFYALFRLMGFNTEVSFQYWFILTSVLNYTCCYVLLLHVFKNNYAAALGAMVFAFSIALQSQMSHAQTFPRFAIPLAIWMGVLYLKELKPAYFFGMLLFLVYQMYCGFYLGFMLFVPLAFLILFSFIYKWSVYRIRFQEIKWWAYIVNALLINLVLLLPLMLPYMQRARQVELYSYDYVLQTVPTLRSYFYSHYGSLFWEFLKDTGRKYDSYWDHQIFAGAIATLAFITSIGIMLGKLLKLKLLSAFTTNGTTLLLFATGFVTFLCFIRFQGYSLYQLIHHLPGFGSMRSLQRIINIELVFYAIAAAFLFEMVFQRAKKYSAVLFILFVALIYFDNHISNDSTDRYTVQEAQERKNSLLEKMKGIKPGSVVSYEPDTLVNDVAFYQLDAMHASQAAGLGTLNGYTANSPHEYSHYWEKPNEANRLRWLKEKGLLQTPIFVIH